MPANQAWAARASSETGSFDVHLARNVAEVREAQRLRYRVFAGEMGASLPGREQGIDCDLYDAYCDHLLVRDRTTDEVVGTYRILTAAQAGRVGSFYSEDEFDLTRLRPLRPAMVEVGRSCVHPDYRSGTVIAMLWSGIASYMIERDHRYLIGCASIGMADGGRAAASIYDRLERSHLGPVEYRVFPRFELPSSAAPGDAPAPIPPLIKGYLRLGACVCGAPAWDPDFNTADLFMLLPMSRLAPRYERHFFRR